MIEIISLKFGIFKYEIGKPNRGLKNCEELNLRSFYTYLVLTVLTFDQEE